MKRFVSLTFLVVSSMAIAQSENSLWKSNISTAKAKTVSGKNLPQKNLYDLDLNALHEVLVNSPKRMFNAQKSNTRITLPNAEGTFETFRVFENSVMDPALAERYPEIKSYVAVGVENPGTRVYFSLSPLGFKSMTLSPGKPTEFIEPITADMTTYTVYRKSDYKTELSRIECSVIDEAVNTIGSDTYARPNADDAKLRTFRLALSCTGEYTTYFGGTKALALAGMNNTLTRCNGIFETDFGLRLVLVATNDNVIYTSSTTDPYSDATSMSNWNSQLQSTLTAVIGESNYDIGHLLGATGGGGNAGCIGCVCVNGQKGSGYTSPSSGIPAGDNFDIDYVAHELGHQLGANHTYTHVTESGTGAQMEPGSGSTIMSYAGITTKDVQRHSDPYFHAISIQQVTNKIKAKTCPTLTNTGNAIPVVNAGLDYTIPKGTPFMLTGTASDANGDVLTYAWEEMDLGTATTATPTATATSGPVFRSYSPTTSPIRYFPRMTTVLSGSTTTAGTEIPWEVMPTVGRTLNFRLTVRDNRAGGSANNSDDAIVTVNGTAGPFKVSTPNTAVSYSGGSTQNISWNVAGTTANGVNCANVDIVLSTDGGLTFSTTLLSGTPNDGSENIVIPNIAGTTNRIMVKGSNHIFFDVSDANFTITNGTVVADTVPPAPVTTLSASGTTAVSTNLSWTPTTDNVGVTNYEVYQNGLFRTSTTATTLPVTGLLSALTYNYYVIAKDAAGNASPASNIANVTTLLIDLLAPSSTTLTASGTTTNTTNLSWTPAIDNVAVTGYDIYQNGVFKATTTSTSYAATGLTASTAYNFYVVAKDAAGNTSFASNTVSVNTLANVTSYCTSLGRNSSREYIKRVQLGSIDNNSGNNGGYADFTLQSTDLAIGTTNAVTITPAWTGSTYAEAYRIWIDFNQDGDFADSGEQVFNQSKTKSISVSGKIVVPTSALLGKTRMRVSMKFNAFPTMCETFAYGEVEDYTVSITASARIEEDSIAKFDFKLYPNPVRGDILNISSLDNPATFRIFNMMGQEIAKDKIENQSVYVGSLRAGHYLIEVSDGVSTATKQFIKQ